MLFPWYIKYPNQNDEILNLDWILSTIDNLVNEVANFVSLNTIKYADPIQWNITTQYEKNTVVIDPITGSAYISTKPVPSGVGLNNTDYWNVIFTLDVISANKNITLRDDANNILATFESEVDDWLLWQGTLYIVTRAIEIGQSYVVGYNIDRYTVERFLKEYITNLRSYVDTTIGDLTDLETTVKTDVVTAINSLLTDVSTLIGDLTDLETTDKDSIVDAINELVQLISNINTNIGTLSQLNTTAKNSLVAAINEVVGYCGDLDDLNTTTKTSLVAALNEVLLTLANTTGDLDDLHTTNKTNLVAAINEVAGSGINVIDVIKEGAKGDGSTNNATVFTGIFNSLQGGEIILIPHGDFRILADINITKPCTILGGGSFMKGLWSGSHEGSILRFSGGNGIKIKSAGINIEGIGIIGNANNVAIEYQADSEIGIGSICGTLKNINIWQVNFGVKFIKCFKTIMENVFVHTANVCFELGESTVGFTSLTMINCWAANANIGYRMWVGIYSSLINCACDNCANGYMIEYCGGIKLLNCGVEGATEVPVLMEGCTDVVIDGLVAVECGGNTYNSSLVRMQSGNSRCTITNSQTIRPKAGMYGIVCISSASDNFIYNNKINNINFGGTIVNDNHIVLQADS